MKNLIKISGVARSNATLNLLKTVSVSDADAKRIEGEAKALRAHYHFEAYRLWRNIPYYKEDAVDSTSHHKNW